MRKFYTLLLALGGLMSLNAQIVLQDNFESYPTGPYYGGHWTNWSQSSSATAEHIIVSEDKAFSGTKSGFIGDSEDQDAILVFPMMSSGIHSFQFKVYIPAGRTAYYNFQNTLANLGVDGNWGNQIHLGTTPTTVIEVTPGTGYITGTEYYYEFTYPEDTWFTVTHVIDLDEITTRFFIDGNEVIPIDGSAIPYPGDYISIEGMDFYSHTANNFYYIDDIVVMDGDITMGVSDVQNASTISSYPTVVKDMFNVTAKSNISEIVVFNTSGQQVMKVAPNGTSAQVNVSALPAGVYLVKTTAGKEVKTTKVVVK